MNNEVFESSFVSYRVENALLIATYPEALKIDLEAARFIVHHRLKFTNGVIYPTLLYARHLRAVDKAARDYFAAEGTKGMSALAIIVENFISVVATKLFVTFSKPQIPIKVFKDAEQAVEWLSQFKARS
jgi:hypothetical protein